MPGSPAHQAPGVMEPIPQEPRTYAITGGRTTAHHALKLETQVKPGRGRHRSPSAETLAILAACAERSVSVAEVAHALSRPVWAAKVLISDLLDAGALIVPVSASAQPERDPAILLRVLEGLRRRA